ncbi:unnamed protein product [Bathycoccus prasinos]
MTSPSAIRHFTLTFDRQMLSFRSLRMMQMRRSFVSSSLSSSDNGTSENVNANRKAQTVRLQRFYIDTGTFETGAKSSFSLSKEDSRHALKSLRLRVDDTIEVCDGQGRVKRARLVDVDSRRTDATFEMLSSKEENFHPFPGRVKWDVVCACAGIKGERSSVLVEKLTELNGRALVPLLTSRSGKIGSASASGKTASKGGSSSDNSFGRSKRRKDEEEEDEETGKELRWQRVALAASKQSLRAHVFGIEKPVSFNDFVTGGADFAEKLRGVKEAILKDDDENTKERYGLIIIGPEGDFDDDEMKVVMDTCETISLGDLRLRTETAAIASLSIAQMITNV